MDVTIRVDGAASAVDELLRLRTWIDEDAELRGRSRMAVASPEAGELGGLPEALIVAVAAGVPAALASVVMAWLQRGTSKITLTIVGAGGTKVELQRVDVRQIPYAELPGHVEALARALEPPDPD
ncbi:MULTISPECIES: effector-associated constant component EACC1 [unclassified Streptomyces]|uniref:effector-associated constant component EACC1 n=1 Tax=Streptomyces sp. NPDC059517 TaxID=3346855 RepID=UPI0036A138BB